MTGPKNNQDQLLKVVQDGQRNQRLATIGIILQILASVAFFGVTIWSTWKKKRTTPAVRLIRKKGRIGKVKLRQNSEKDRMESRHKSEMDRELLELDILEREVKHESELKKFEVGLESQEEKEILEKTNPLTSLKQKSESFIRDKMSQVKEKVTEKTFDSLNQASDKFTSSMDKSKDKDKSRKDKE